MTRTTHNTCALAQPRFTHDRSVCPVVALYGVDADDPDAQWEPYCSLTADKLSGFSHWTDPAFDARLQAANESLRRLEEFCNRNRCRVSP